ncbi:MAG: hotdog fold thioesterase [Desulfobulbus sp.]|nr:hotdog fold thioesterase [Desulfobulbus sp.]
MWKKRPTLEEMQTACTSTLVANLGIEFTAVGEDFIEARMPVDERTVQPMGVLHGGASAALAETLGGAGAYLSVEEGTICVGLEINANHVRPAARGWVVGRATPLHIGKTTQVWQILIRDDAERLVCVSRLTVAMRPAPIPAQAQAAGSSAAGKTAEERWTHPSPFGHPVVKKTDAERQPA